jgi:hypothetical protein
MAELSQLEAALVKADAAGNTEDARALANEIRRLRGSPEKMQPAPTDGGFQGSVLGGIVQGGRDVLDAGAQALSHIMPESVRNVVNSANNYLADKTGLVGRLPEGGIDQKIKEDEAAYQQARAASGRDGIDASRITGNIAATIPMAGMKGLQLARGKGLFDAGNIVRAGIQGGIAGASQPVVNGDFGEEKLNQIGTGAAFGAAMAPVGAAVGKALSPNVNPQVKALMDQGVTPTPGQIIGGALQRAEDKLMSVPLLGDAITAGRKRAVEQLNRAAYTRALEGTGVDAKSLPVGREGIAAVKEAISKQYDDLLPKLVFKPDSQFSQELSKIQQMASGMGQKEQAKFQSLLDDIANKTSPNGTMIGETYKTVESKLSQEAKRFSGSNDAYQQELGQAISATLDSMKSNLLRSNPKYAKELAQANSNYANYVRLRQAGAAAGDQSRGFSPSQLAQAVRGSDKSVGKGNVASGKALMQDLSDAGVNVLNSKYPDSGSIGRALLAGGLGASAIANPAIIGVGAAALPYTPSGQKIMAALLTKRPDFAKLLGPNAQKLAPLVGASVAQHLLK